MNAIINRHIFTVARFDSGALGAMASVVHTFSQTGKYQAVIRRNGKVIGQVGFAVDDACMVMQLDIDLSDPGARTAHHKDCGCGTGASELCVSPKGYVLFHAASASGGYSVVVGPAGSGGKAVFDSEQLGEGDLFVLSLLEPVQYAMRNQLGKAQGRIAVSFSEKDAPTLSALQTQYVEASRDAFSPAEVNVTATQGIVFRVREAARIIVERNGGRPKPESAKKFRALRRG